jgi:hypothetical protein
MGGQVKYIGPTQNIKNVFQFPGIREAYLIVFFGKSWQKRVLLLKKCARVTPGLALGEER